MSLNGTFVIRSQLTENAFLTPGLERPVFVRVLGREPYNGEPVKWNVTSVGGNVYTIASEQYGHVVTQPDNDGLWVTIAPTPATPFSIEPAGDGVYRIHVPNEDRIATLNEYDTQVQVSPAKGLAGQAWIFTRVD